MGVAVQRYIEWRAGAGSPLKYEFEINAVADVVSMTSTAVTVNLHGSAFVTNHPNDSKNTWAASDYAVLTVGGYDPADYQFTQGTSYYKWGLPTLPNAPDAYLAAMIAEFRGDSYATDGANRTSFWIKDVGIVQDRNANAGRSEFLINHTFTVQLTGQRDQPILIWNSSGANNSTSYSWLTHQVWLSLVDLDYRPGKIMDNNLQAQSHNRAAGFAKIRNGSNGWTEMRTVNGATASDNPPLIMHSEGRKNMRKIGLNA